MNTFEEFRAMLFLLAATFFYGLWRFASMSEWNLELVRGMLAVMIPIGLVFALICWGAGQLDGEQVGNYFVDDPPRKPNLDKGWPFEDLGDDDPVGSRFVGRAGKDKEQ